MLGLALRVLGGLLGWSTLLLAILCFFPAVLGLTRQLADVSPGENRLFGLAFAAIAAGLFVSGASLAMYASERTQKRSQLLASGLAASAWMVLLGVFFSWKSLALDGLGRLPLETFALVGLGLANAAMIFLLHRAWCQATMASTTEQPKSSTEPSD